MFLWACKWKSYVVMHGLQLRFPDTQGQWWGEEVLMLSVLRLAFM